VTCKKWYTGTIRTAVIANGEKILKCRTGQLGFHAYKCPKCKEVKLVPHSCKSRFHLL
jgi:phage FluMu protein Com